MYDCMQEKLVEVMRYSFPREGVAYMYVHSDKIAGKEEQTYPIQWCMLYMLLYVM